MGNSIRRFLFIVTNLLVIFTNVVFADDYMKVTSSAGTYRVIFDEEYLWLSGTNADQDVNIGTYDFSAGTIYATDTGTSTFTDDVDIDATVTANTASIIGTISANSVKGNTVSGNTITDGIMTSTNGNIVTSTLTANSTIGTGGTITGNSVSFNTITNTPIFNLGMWTKDDILFLPDATSTQSRAIFYDQIGTLRTQIWSTDGTASGESSIAGLRLSVTGSIRLSPTDLNSYWQSNIYPTLTDGAAGNGLYDIGAPQRMFNSIHLDDTVYTNAVTSNTVTTSRLYAEDFIGTDNRITGNAVTFNTVYASKIYARDTLGTDNQLTANTVSFNTAMTNILVDRFNAEFLNGNSSSAFYGTKNNDYKNALYMQLNWQKGDKQAVTLATGESQIHSLLYINKYDAIFAGTRTTPAKLLKFSNLNDLSSYSVITFPTGLDHLQAESMCYDATKDRIYIAFAYSGPGNKVVVTEVNPSDLTYTDVIADTTELAGGSAAITSDGTSLYMITYTSPSKIIKYNLTTYAKTSSLTINDGAANKNTGHGLVYDGTNLYGTGASSPAWIAKINPSDLTHTVRTFAGGENTVTDDIANVDDYVFCGLETTDGKVMRVRKSDLSLTRIATGQTTANYGAYYDGLYVWLPYNSTPGNLVRIDPVTLEIAYHTLGSGENSANECVSDGQRLFVTCWQSPAKIIRLTNPSCGDNPVKYSDVSGNVVFVTNSPIPSQNISGSGFGSSSNPQASITLGFNRIFGSEIETPKNLAGTATTGGSLANGSHYFQVVAVNSLGTSIASSQLWKWVSNPPNNAVSLTWDSVFGKTSYRIYHSTTAAAGSWVYKTSTANSYLYTDDTGATTGDPTTVCTAWMTRISGNTVTTNDLTLQNITSNTVSFNTANIATVSFNNGNITTAGAVSGNTVSSNTITINTVFISNKLNLPVVTSIAERDIWSDTTQKSLAVFTNGIKQMLPGVIYVETSGYSVANTVTETNLINSGVGTVTLPANFFTIGKTIRITAWGYMRQSEFGTPGNPTFRVRLGGVGGTQITTTGVIDQNGQFVDEGWTGIAYITCLSTGATGSVTGGGGVNVFDGGTQKAPLSPLDNTSSVTINTTTSQAIAFTLQWSAADVNNSATSQGIVIEVLN